MKKTLLQQHFPASAKPIPHDETGRASPTSSLIPSNVMTGLVSLTALVVIAVVIDRLLKALGV
jgi:hypothetical protein